MGAGALLVHSHTAYMIGTAYTTCLWCSSFSRLLTSSHTFFEISKHHQCSNAENKTMSLTLWLSHGLSVSLCRSNTLVVRTQLLI